jgi:signal transduction histidine kinase
VSTNQQYTSSVGNLPESLERQAEEVRSASGAVLLFDGDDRIVAASDSCSVVFERVVEDLVGQTLGELIDDGYLEPTIREKHRYANDELRATDGEDRQESFRASVNPAGEDDQHVYGVRIEPVGASEQIGTRWALSDIGTSQHYGQSIDALHVATRDLMDATAELEVFDVVGQAANDALGFPGVGVRSYDPSAEVLRHVAFGSVVEEIDSRPPFDVHDSPHGRAFRQGTTIIESPPETDDPFGREAFSQVMYVPMGEEGVLSVGAIGTDFENSDRRFAEILAENAAAALEQVHQRKRLREQRDELERRKDRLVTQREELERQNQRLEAFGSILSHDLRNPLTLAKGSLQRMRTAGDESALEDVEYALDRIDDIIDDVLTLAREGTDVQNTEPVSLESVARTAWETVDTRALSLSIDSDMRVEADPDRLQRALENLFRNTIEHATLAAGASDDAEESIGDEATVVRIGPLEDRTGFFVEDDGSGIEPDQRDKVFERGYSTASEGTGLGLVIVQELVQAHGWSMQVADERNGGARFEISI